MQDFKITCDNGNITVVSARQRSTAIELYIQSEGCSVEWFCKHCRVKKITVNDIKR